MEKAISVRFKDKNKVFKGKTYDYKVLDGEDDVKAGDIIRMMDDDLNWICYGTRVRVESVRPATKADVGLLGIRLVLTTLDD